MKKSITTGLVLICFCCELKAQQLGATTNGISYETSEYLKDARSLKTNGIIVFGIGAAAATFGFCQYAQNTSKTVYIPLISEEKRVTTTKGSTGMVIGVLGVGVSALGTAMFIVGEKDQRKAVAMVYHNKGVLLTPDARPMPNTQSAGIKFLVSIK